MKIFLAGRGRSQGVQLESPWAAAGEQHTASGSPLKKKKKRMKNFHLIKYCTRHTAGHLATVSDYFSVLALYPTDN